MDEYRIKKEQARLAELVIIRDDFKQIEKIAGVDVTILNNEKLIAAVVVCDKEFNQIDKAYAINDLKKEKEQAVYIEGPAIIDAVKKLKITPDIILINGHGITHPRLGLASYVGLTLNISTIGVAKNLRTGTVIDGLVYVDNEIRGYEVITRDSSKPVYVSPGHKVSLKSSIAIVKDCIKWPHKLPEPLALAHKYLNKVKKDL